jgi:hypothetical protein
MKPFPIRTRRRRQPVIVGSGGFAAQPCLGTVAPEDG